MYYIHVILLSLFKIIVLCIDSMENKSMSIFDMNDVFDKVCKAWNEHDFNQCSKESCNTDFRKCKHKFTKYDTLGDNSRMYYCSKCGLCE